MTKLDFFYPSIKNHPALNPDFPLVVDSGRMPLCHTENDFLLRLEFASLSDLTSFENSNKAALASSRWRPFIEKTSLIFSAMLAKSEGGARDQ